MASKQNQKSVGEEERMTGKEPTVTVTVKNRYIFHSPKNDWKSVFNKVGYLNEHNVKEENQIMTLPGKKQ